MLSSFARSPSATLHACAEPWRAANSMAVSGAAIRSGVGNINSLPIYMSSKTSGGVGLKMALGFSFIKGDSREAAIAVVVGLLRGGGILLFMPYRLKNDRTDFRIRGRVVEGYAEIVIG